jgi:hypothetical protein
MKVFIKALFIIGSVVTLSFGNNAPTASDITIIIDEDTNKTFGMAEAGAINYQDVDFDNMDSLYITTLPTKGTLTLSDVNVTVNQRLIPSQIESLVFTPVTDEHGIPYTTFGFKVSDGEDNSTEQTVIVNVTSVNDASPTITSTAVSSVDEDSVYSYTLEASDADGDQLTWKITDGRNLPDWLSLSNELNFTTATNPLDSATIRLYSMAAFVDIDNDGDLDFFFGEYDGSMHYYKNTGSNSVAVFEVQTGTNDPLDGVNVGSNSAPAFVDIDNDGDFDLFIGEYNKNINYYKNTGSNTTPVFEEQTGALNPLDGLLMGNFTNPTFADIDNDGDMDLFVGEKDGIVHYYKNTGSNTVAVFEEQTGALNLLDGVDIGIKSVPSFVDIDEDGDLDLFIGAADGNIYHYKNTGSNTVAVFEEQTGVDNPLDSLDVGGHSGPVFVDIDNDHDMDLFITQDNGANGIVYYKNDSSTLLSGVTTNADVGQYDINLTLSDGIDTVEYNFQITVNNVNDAPTFNTNGLVFAEDAFDDTLSLTSTDWIHEGGDSYRSKDITHDESSSHIIEINPNNDANISFDWTVSSEEDYDFFEYYVDGNKLFFKSGEDYGTYIHTLSSGTHTLEWRYIKDGSESVGADDANISNITLTNVGGAIINYDKVLISQEENIASVVDIDGEDIDVGDILEYTISGTDSALFHIDTTNGKLKFINAPDYESPIDLNEDNLYELNVSITDQAGAFVSKELFITVTNVDEAPVLETIPNQTIYEEGALNITLNSSDAEGDPITYTASSSDITKATVNIVNGKLVVTPIANKSGTVTVTVNATANGQTTTQTFTIELPSVNTPPTLDKISNVYVYKNSTTESILVNATDSGSILNYSATYTNNDLIDDINFRENNMTVYMNDGITGESNITVMVSDGEYNATSSFIFKVLALQENDSVKNGGDITVDENQTVVIRFEEDDITVSAPTQYDANGSISHQITIGETKVKASSSLTGTVVEPTDTGVHTTYTDTNLSLEVNATITGAASHSLTTNGKTTKATSEFVGAQTLIHKVNGLVEIETAVQIDNNTSIKVTAKEDGTAQHVVNVGTKTSKATSIIAGAKTLITTSGEVETSVEELSGGYIIKAVVTTKADGTSITKFVKEDINTGAQIDVSNTMITTTPYPAGNDVTIDTIGTKLFIKTVVPIEDDLEVE